MPLAAPPPAGVLAGLPGFRLPGLVLHRVYDARRGQPWWFGSAPAEPEEGGRFDLPAPRGTCYLGTSPAAAVLEAFQDFGAGLLPAGELRRRRRAEVVAPPTAPIAAHLTARLARGHGVTAALWSGQDRALTQAWAAGLDRAGWRALRCGVQHDPTGALRSVALLDDAGAHLPWDDEAWQHTDHDLADDGPTHRALAAHGITVTADPDLPVVTLAQSGL